MGTSFNQFLLSSLMFWTVLNLKHISLGEKYPKSVLRLVRLGSICPALNHSYVQLFPGKNKQSSENSYGDTWSKALEYICSAVVFQVFRRKNQRVTLNNFKYLQHTYSRRPKLVRLQVAASWPGGNMNSKATGKFCNHPN